MEAAPDLEAALAVLRAAGSRLRSATDACAHGSRDAVELVAHVARVDRPTAKRRVGLGAALAPEVSLLGEPLPGRFGVRADAVAAGEVGVDSARVIAEKVLHLQRRISTDDLANAVAFLTDEARVKQTELVRDAADALAAILDPDGAERTNERTNERNQHLQRVFRSGRMRADGMTPGRILLTPEHVATLKELLESQRRNVPLIRTTAGGSETCDEPDPERREGLPPEGDGPAAVASRTTTPSSARSGGCALGAVRCGDARGRRARVRRRPGGATRPWVDLGRAGGHPDPGDRAA